MAMLAGCSEGERRDLSLAPESSRAGHHNSTPIFVRPFTFQNTEIYTDSTEQERQPFKQEIASTTQDRLIELLATAGKPVKAPLSTPERGWLIEGNFIEVLDKSYMRYMLGFERTGAGVSARIRMFNLSVSPSVPFITLIVPTEDARISPDKARRVVSIHDLAKAVRERISEEISQNQSQTRN